MLIFKKEGGNVDYLKDPLFLRQIIMDHYENPRNYEKGPFDDSVSIRKKSDSCIDDLSFELVLKMIESRISVFQVMLVRLQVLRLRL